MTGSAGRDGGNDADAKPPTDGSPDGDAKGDTKIDGSPDGVPDGSPDMKTDSTGAAGSDGGAGTGAAGSDGGAGTGAAGSDGGAGTGSDGGAGTGAAGSDGGAGTTGSGGMGGMAGTGSGGMGGMAGTGSGGMGGMAGTGTAGTGAAGTTAPPACYSVTFTNPVDLAQLSAADDKDGDNCGNGFQHDVVITTAAPNGTSVQLFAGAVNVATVTVSGGQATFPGVQLASSGDTVLSIQFPSTAPCTAATTKAKVTVDCSVPTCAVSKPVISGAHPALNGVPSTLGGDRVSGTGSPYEAAFEVTTNIADNQNVFLDVNDATTPGTVSTVTAKASGGKAVFAGVALPPGATYQIQARCIDAHGVVGRSTKGSYPVDATAPVLTVSQPASGDFIGPANLPGGNFQVCGSTTSSDAVALPPALGAGALNFCAVISGSPTCKAVPAVSTSTCVALACPGDAPFNVTVTLTDAAGNPQTQTLTGITCSANTPNVQIISPISDAPTFNDPTRHLLAATAAQPFRDQTGAVAGAQTDVVACSSRGGTAALFAGHTGDANLVQVGGTVLTTAATALDGCPSGHGFVAKFLGVTLPESFQDATTGVLTTATQLRVDVTDISSSVGKSTPLNLWVDSVAPVFTLKSPVGLCGSFQQAFATFDTSIVYTSDTPNITLSIVNNSATDTLSSPTYASGEATFPLVSFNQGQSNLAAVANDAAGNKTAAPQPCTVTAGMAPVVLFTSPTSTSQLCPANGLAANCIDDADTNQAGWQGSLTVHALVGGLPITSGNITFSAGGAPLGVAALNSSGDATLNNVTFFDGTVTITAQTANIPGNGVGVGTLSIVVDLGGPDPIAPADFKTTITDRRQTTIQLSWKAPGDNGQPVVGYDIRRAREPITALNFDNPAITTVIPYGGAPQDAGDDDGIAVEDLYIETGYHFAIRSIDAAGNRSAITATTAETKATFNQTVLTPPAANQQFGRNVTVGDLNGDGLSDIAVGTLSASKAYVYLGNSSVDSMGRVVYTPTLSTTITGSVPAFGLNVTQIGDIDDDGFVDLAVSDSVTAQKIYIYKGRAVWPSTLTDLQADYTISTDATYAASFFGFSMARLGDFTGDGIDDFAIGARSYNASVGRVIIIKGKPKAVGFTSVTLPDATNAITIDGDTALGKPFLGYRVLGLGHFYSGTGTTLVISSIGTSTSTPANQGQVYGFRGQSGTGGAISIATADDRILGPSAGARIGEVLTNLGTMMNGFPAVGVGNILDTVNIPGGHGGAYLLSGTPTTSLFTNNKVTYQDGENASGGVLIGGGIPGTDTAVSLIGDDTPDLVFAGLLAPKITISDGAKIGAKTSPNNVAATAEISISVPHGWATSEGSTAIINDINGDHAADFCLGSQLQPGGVLVFW
jgi:hypothetical protein